MNRMKAVAIAALAMTATQLPEFTQRPSRRFRSFFVDTDAIQAEQPEVICARLREFFKRRPRPWRTWRGSQRTSRKAHRR
jgi:hypothetical protein